MKEIELTNEDCRRVEKEYFEYQAIKDVLAFLSAQDTVNIGVLKTYMVEAEERYAALERIKREISQQYCPADFANKAYNYNFNFDNQKIIYEEVK